MFLSMRFDLTLEDSIALDVGLEAVMEVVFYWPANPPEIVRKKQDAI